jgi:hypothetical protein
LCSLVIFTPRLADMKKGKSKYGSGVDRQLVF